MLRRHEEEWVKADGTGVDGPVYLPDGRLSGPLHVTADIELPGEAPFRAEVDRHDEWKIVLPAAGQRTGFLVHLKSRKVRFDPDDPRNGG
jgi:hypothetical protein